MNLDTQNLSYIIAFSILKDKEGLVDFLSTNAVIVKPEITDEELSALLISALSSSQKIQENFISWVELKTRKNSHSNFKFQNPGYDFSSSVSSGTTLAPTSSTATTTSSSGFWSGFDAGAVTGFLSSGLNLFGSITSSKEQRKALEAQANAQIAASNAQANSDMTQLQIAQLQLQAAQSSGGKNTSGSNTTLIIVGIVGGLAILGTVIYFVTRKK